MKGDRLIINDHHLAAAKRIAEIITARTASNSYPYIVCISGESGSGKSEIAQALSQRLAQQHTKTVILQQDDYFLYPPLTNDARRREDIRRVGPEEVQLEWIDRNIKSIANGACTIDKPLVFYSEDRIEIETIDVKGCQVVIAEGTYTSLLTQPQCRIFIDRTYRQTQAARDKRGRESPDPFIERVLELEHQIIKKHKAMADIVITEDHEVHEQSRKA